MRPVVTPNGVQRAGFPRHRVSRVLLRDGCSDRSNRIAAEGPFIQLSADGLPERQVFLGITNSEFILVKQIFLCSSKSVHLDSDPEVADLVLDLVIPHPLLKFFVLDDRAKRFTVCTCLGYMLHFEMCQMDSKCDEIWMSWRHALMEVSGEDGVTYGYKSWRSSSVFDMKKYHTDFEQKLVKFGGAFKGTLDYIHHPFSFNQVRSIGVQTIFTPEEDTVTRRTDVTVHLVSHNSDSSSDSDTSQVDIALGERPSTRLLILSVQTKFAALPATCRVDERAIPNKSDSWTDACHCEDTRQRPWTSELKYEYMKIFKKKLPKKFQSLTELLHADSDTDSDEDLDDVVLEFDTQNSGGRSARDNWKKAKQLVMGKGQSTAMNMLRQVVFRTIGERNTRLPDAIASLDPKDVSTWLTAMSRRLLTSLRSSDIALYTASKGSRIPKRIAAALEFSHSISKMVATEILRCQSLFDRLSTITHFIEICSYLLFHLRDFQALASILSGMTSLPVYRLDNTWATLFMDEQIAFRKFICMERLLSPTGHFSAYTNRVRTCMLKNEPFIPWLEHFLKHCMSNMIDPDNNRCTLNVTKKNKPGRRKGTKNKDKPKSSGKSHKTNSVLNLLSRKRPQTSTSNDGNKLTDLGDKQTVKNEDLSGKNIHENDKDECPTHSQRSILKNAKETKRSKRFSLFQKKSKRVRFDLQDIENDDDNTGRDSLKDIAKTRLAPGIKLGDIGRSEANDVGKAVIDELHDKLSPSPGVYKDSKTFNQPTPRAVTLFSNIQSKKIINNALQDISKGIVGQHVDDKSSGDSDSDFFDESYSTSSSEQLSTDDDQDSYVTMGAGNAYSEKETSLTKQESVVASHPDSHVIPTGSSQPRRTSYVPSVIQGRRKSLFEENIKTVEDKATNEEYFEKMKNERLGRLKNRGSIVLDLLTPDDQEVLENIQGNGHRRRQAGRHLENESNNSKEKKRKGDKKKSKSRQVENKHDLPATEKADTLKGGCHRLSKTLSLDNLFSLSEKCSFCGLKPCVYMHDGRKQLLQFQAIALKIRSRPKRRVKDYILNTIEVNKNLSDYDILQLSFAVE